MSERPTYLCAELVGEVMKDGKPVNAAFECQNLDSRIASLEQENERLRAQRVDALKEVVAVRGQVVDMKAENAAQTERGDHWQAEVERWVESAHGYRKAHEAAESRLAALVEGLEKTVKGWHGMEGYGSDFASDVEGLVEKWRNLYGVSNAGMAATRCADELEAALAKEAWIASAERYLALADELEVDARKKERLGTRAGVQYAHWKRRVAKRLREIAEGKEG